MRDAVYSRRRLLCGVAVAALAGCLGGTDRSAPTAARDDPDQPIHQGYTTREVVIKSSDGERLGAVTAAVADTSQLRYTGLSDTESLPPDRGMLFVHDQTGGRTYVMREMDFPIDIIYADEDGVITEIHHARAPKPGEDGETLRYPGTGMYVLEVNAEWTTDHGVRTGDVLTFEPV